VQPPSYPCWDPEQHGGGGHLEVVNALLEAGGRELLMLTRDDGTSCLFISAQNGHLEVVNALLEAGGGSRRSRTWCTRCCIAARRLAALPPKAARRLARARRRSRAASDAGPGVRCGARRGAGGSGRRRRGSRAAGAAPAGAGGGAATTRRFHTYACEGADENSGQGSKSCGCGPTWRGERGHERN